MDFLSEIELTYHKTDQVVKAITGSEQAAELFRRNWKGLEVQETFKIIGLNRANVPVLLQTISVGGVSSTIVDVRIIFATLLKGLCSSVILCHNHPSGNPAPSNADRQITQKIKDAAALFDISLLDHIILVPKEGIYYSFSDLEQL